MTDFLLRKFVKDYNSTDSRTVREKYGNLAGAVGIFCNLILCCIKITVGAISGSISIIADGLNNLSDMGSSVITIIGFRLSAKPADRDHPFGHGRLEYMAAIAVSGLILFVGIQLFSSSVTALFSSEKMPGHSPFSLAVLAFSVAVKLWMFFFNRSLGKRINSQVLIATSQDSINDAIASTVILLSVAVCMFVSLPFNLDAVMGCGVAVFIFWSGITLARDTIDELIGKPPEEALVRKIGSLIMSNDSFLGIHDLMVHSYGPGRLFASVHVEVPQDVDIVACHEEIDSCEKQVGDELGVNLVIHMDPIDVNDEAVSRARDNFCNMIRDIDPSLSMHDFRMTPDGKENTNVIFDVVLPDGFPLEKAELNRIIGARAREINPKYTCVITFDNDFTGA